MFLFVRRLTANPWVALICGWAFAFYPFAISTGRVTRLHPGLGAGARRSGGMVELQWRRRAATPCSPALAVALACGGLRYFILLAGATYVAALLGSVVSPCASGRPGGPALPLDHRGHRGRIPGLPGRAAALPSTSSSGVRTNTVAEFFAVFGAPARVPVARQSQSAVRLGDRPVPASHLHGFRSGRGDALPGRDHAAVLALIACIALARRKAAPPRGLGGDLVLADCVWWRWSARRRLKAPSSASGSRSRRTSSCVSRRRGVRTRASESS